jgi:hypothetical protein
MLSGWRESPVAYSISILIAAAVLIALVPAASKLGRKPVPSPRPLLPSEILAAGEAISQTSEFRITRGISLKSLVSVGSDGPEEQVYRKLESLGLIEIQGEGDIWKHRRAPNHQFNVTLTDAGTKAAEHWTKDQQGGWTIPIAQPRVIRAYPTGELRGAGRLMVFAVEYKWQPNELGSQLVGILPRQSKVPEETFPANALLLRSDNVWKVIKVELHAPPRPSPATSPGKTP